MSRRSVYDIEKFPLDEYTCNTPKCYGYMVWTGTMWICDCCDKMITAPPEKKVKPDQRADGYLGLADAINRA